MSTIAYMLPGATDSDDCYLYPSEAPPQVRDETHRSPVHSPSHLCEECQAVLEYLAYMLEEKRFGRSTIRDLDLPQVAVHHQNLAVWLANFDIHCHLCYFLLLHLKGPSEWQECFEDVQMEISWGSGPLQKEGEDFERGRLCVALTRMSLPRIEANYHTYIRLQIWPAKKYAQLFLALENPNPAPRSSTQSNDGAEDADAPDALAHDTSDDTSNDGSSSPPDPGASSDVNRKDNDEGNVNDASHNLHSQDLDGNTSDRGTGSYINGSGDNGSDGNGSEGNGSEGNGSEGNGSIEYDSDDNCSDRDHSDDGSNESNLGGRRVVMDAGSTGSQFSQKLVAQWLNRCLNNEDGEHTECNTTGDGWLPTRLIDVNYTTENPVLRLASPKETPEIFEADRRYITLSHCWGEWGSKELPVLKRSNEYDRFHDGISPAELPQTFQHAVEVAHWLKVRWLWIDSLCIIQDSNEDWQREASVMHDVYKRGFLNIAASTAVDARGGLFKPRAPTAFQPVQLCMPGIDETLYLTVDERNMFGWMESEPLSQRAWVFQERHLARRILHFTNTEIFWECCAKMPYFASETFARGAPLKSVFNSKPKLQSESVLKQTTSSTEEVYDLWEDICQMYSEKHLSHQGDKLVALQGLAKEFKDLLPSDEYLAGMWLSRLPESLLWEVEKPPRPIPRQVDVAPSWSWASVCGPIEKRFRYKDQDAEKKKVSVVDIKTDSLVNGSPSSPKLVLSGYIRQITLKDNLIVDRIYPDPTFNNKKELLVHQGPHQLVVGDSSFQHHPAISYSLDNNIDTKVTEAYFLFLTWTEDTKNSPRFRTSGLLLLSTSERNTFTRCGTLHLTGYGAVAAKYQVKEDVTDRVESWNSFNRWLRNRVGRFRRDDNFPEAVDSRSGMSVTEGLYDYDWIIDHDEMDVLKPQDIVLI
ncbi:MAG: hypothetical protein Q9171_004928 [Xanthocarpia ochracea]